MTASLYQNLKANLRILIVQNPSLVRELSESCKLLSNIVESHILRARREEFVIRLGSLANVPCEDITGSTLNIGTGDIKVTPVRYGTLHAEDVDTASPCGGNNALVVGFELAAFKIEWVFDESNWNCVDIAIFANHDGAVFTVKGDP